MRVIANHDDFGANEGKVEVSSARSEHAERRGCSCVETYGRCVVRHSDDALRHRCNPGSVRQLFSDFQIREIAEYGPAQ